MSKHILPSNFFNRIKSRNLDYGYQQLDSDEHEEFILPLSCDNSRRTSYASDLSSSEPPHIINELKDVSEDDTHAACGSTKRIISQNSKYFYELVYEIHDGFTSDQILVIENALQIVADRLFKPEILQNLYQICGSRGYCFTQEVLLQSNLIQNTVYLNKYLLLNYQLMCLKAKSENGEFPIINIYPVHGKDSKDNQTSSACIYCISHGSSFLIEGEFEIELDQEKLNGSVQNSSNALFWAGEIVYELLHNLGHRYKENGYMNRSQIQIFKQCFLHNGNYIPLKSK